jgi:hypothetical protein
MAYDVVTPVQLGQAAITVANATLYTTPASTRTFVKDLTVCNTTSSAITFNVHLVPSGGAAGTSNALFYGVSLAPNSTMQWNGVQILHAGGFVVTSASATGLTITASGAEAV